MQLEIDCSWNEKKCRAKQKIHFDYRPKTLFCLPQEKIELLQTLGQNAHLEGPRVLEELDALVKQYPKSLYAQLIYFQTLQFFEYQEEAHKLLSQMKNAFPGQVFVKCLLGEILFRSKREEEFPALFNHVEVLQGAFSRRRGFFFEEALFFHNLWGRYFFEKGDEIQAQKHTKFIFLIVNTLKNVQETALAL